MTNIYDTGHARMELATAVRTGDELREMHARQDLSYAKVNNTIVRQSREVASMTNMQFKDLLVTMTDLRGGDSYGEPITEGQRDFLLRAAYNILRYVADHPPLEDDTDAYYEEEIAHELVRHAAIYD